MRSLTCAFLLLATTISAHAQEVSLGRPGGDTVFVWRDDDAHSEAVRLITAGVHKSNPLLVMKLMSCMVDAGTKAVVVDGGFVSSTVLITAGEHAGCRGDIPNEDLRR